MADDNILDPNAPAVDGVTDTQGAVSTPAVDINIPDNTDPGSTGNVDQGYTDLANVQANTDTIGLDVNGMNTQMSDNVAIKKGSDFITPGMKVEDRLNSFLDKDSDIMKREQSFGDMLAARVGLKSTTMGGAATRGRMIDKAVDITSKDAATEAKFGLQQQQADNAMQSIQGEGIVSGKLGEQEQRAASIDSAFKTASRGLDAKQSKAMERIKNDWNVKAQKVQNDFEADLQERLKRQDISAAEAADIRRQSNEVFMNHQITLGNLYSDQNFLDLDAKSANQLVNNLANGMSETVRYINLSAGINTSQQNSYLTRVNNAYTFG